MSNCAWCFADMDSEDTICPACGQPTRLAPPTIQEIAAKRAASPRPAIGKKRFWDGTLSEWDLHPLGWLLDVIVGWCEWLLYWLLLIVDLVAAGVFRKPRIPRKRGSGTTAS
jgi:hypothetical protein